MKGEQLSVTDTGAKLLTTAVGLPKILVIIKSAGQLITGATVSITVKLSSVVITGIGVLTLGAVSTPASIGAGLFTKVMPERSPTLPSTSKYTVNNTSPLARFPTPSNQEKERIPEAGIAPKLLGSRSSSGAKFPILT